MWNRGLTGLSRTFNQRATHSSPAQAAVPRILTHLVAVALRISTQLETAIPHTLINLH